MAGAIAALALALLTSATATAAPYPPSEPCSVAAAYRAPEGTDGATARYDVTGTGLGATQPVRVALAEDGRTLGYATTDDEGRFTTAVTAPVTADGGAPAINAASPTQSCTWTPPGPSTTPTRPGAGGSRTPTGTVPGQPGAPNSGTGGNGGDTTGGNDGSTPGGPSSPGGPAGSTGPTGTTGAASPTAAGPTSSPAPTDAPSFGRTAPPRAEPRPGTQPPFGIGLAIAAALLVLGTLAVLVLTRRPER